MQTPAFKHDTSEQTATTDAIPEDRVRLGLRLFRSRRLMYYHALSTFFFSFSFCFSSSRFSIRVTETTRVSLRFYTKNNGRVALDSDLTFTSFLTFSVSCRLCRSFYSFQRTSFCSPFHPFIRASDIDGLFLRNSSATTFPRNFVRPFCESHEGRGDLARKRSNAKRKETKRRKYTLIEAIFPASGSFTGTNKFAFKFSRAIG